MVSKKVLVIGPCLSMGGMERASSNVANEMVKHGLKVVYLAIFKKDHFFQLDENVILDEPKEGINENKLSFFKTISRIRRRVLYHEPDSILVFNKFYGAISALALIGNKVPFYVSERSSPLFVWKKSLKIINQIAFWLNSPNGVIAQTSIAAKYQKRYYRKSRIQVIPNILRNSAIYPNLERHNIILAVGRLGDYLKGFDLLLKSFALIKNKEWELHIAGGDENGQYLKDLALKLGVLNRVKFLGKVKEIDLVFAQAGLFVIPSRSEGFPNSLLEAMAAGVASIAFDFVAGPKDIIENGENGIIVPEGDIESLAMTIDKLILSPGERKRLGSNAKKIRDVYESGKITRLIIKFIFSNK
tara:strand:+ start:10325 stop:11398 length:1074 start_codon:yes stop_codon:yes gene_type:complete